MQAPESTPVNVLQSIMERNRPSNPHIRGECLIWDKKSIWLIKRQRTHSIYGLRPLISFSQVRDELRCKDVKIILTSIKISWNFIIQKNLSISCIFSNIISNIYSCSRVVSSQNYLKRINDVFFFYLIRIMYKILRFLVRMIELIKTDSRPLTGTVLKD